MLTNAIKSQWILNFDITQSHPLLEVVDDADERSPSAETSEDLSLPYRAYADAGLTHTRPFVLHVQLHPISLIQNRTGSSPLDETGKTHYFDRLKGLSHYIY